MHTGPLGRSQRTSKAWKSKVAILAVQGKLARSGMAIVEIMQELRPGFTVPDAKGANSWIADLSKQYLHILQHNFRLIAEHLLFQPIYNLAWDDTRLAKRDSLVCTIYCPDIDLAAWAPPLLFLCERRCELCIREIPI